MSCPGRWWRVVGGEQDLILLECLCRMAVETHSLVIAVDYQRIAVEAGFPGAPAVLCSMRRLQAEGDWVMPRRPLRRREPVGMWRLAPYLRIPAELDVWVAAADVRPAPTSWREAA